MGCVSEFDVTLFALGALARQGSPRFALDDERPDEKVRHGKKAIDFLARTNDGRVLGIEHTRIEPYEGFLADWTLADERLGEVRDLLVGRLPTDSVFDISIEPASATRISRRNAQVIADWIEHTAPKLGQRPPGHFAVSPDDLFGPPLTLYRSLLTEGVPAQPQVRYRIGVETGRTGETLVDRCRRSMEEKLPKLEEARDAHGATWTLLCLESSDFQLTDPFGLAGVLKNAAEGLPSPDYVVMVLVGPDDVPFMSWTYRESGQWLDRPHLNSPEATTNP